MSLLSKEEKERIYRTLVEDKEFRYSLMGLLGFQELLERFTSLEERQQRLEERFAKLEERFAELEERFLKLEERQQRLEERFARLEATVGAIGRRFGKGFESLYRKGVGLLLEELGVEEYMVKRFVFVDREGRYLAKGTNVEIDMVVRDGQLWLLEIKSTVDTDDVSWFSVKARVAEEVLGRRADRKVLMGVVVDRSALEEARRKGIEVVYVTLVEDDWPSQD